jgi:transcriptional regulator with PAS, ATPase and Fis domain
VPDLQVEGFRPVVEQKEVNPYQVQIACPGKQLAIAAEAIPIHGDRQPVGTLLILPHVKSSQIMMKRPSPWQTTYTFADLKGQTPAFQQCLTIARRAAEQEFPVLLLGESGTGKELFAQAIHAASPRSYGPFVPVNCGAPTDELLAAELFGYVEGAFTGAVKGGRRGKIELATGGTLFLDEVEAMSPKMQVSLLRVLEEGRIARVGAESPVRVNVRIIAASNEDLAEEVRKKIFRLDLYHRLAAFPITLPPLRERYDDLPLLALHFLEQLGFAHLRISPEMLAALRRYSWPGNLRELRNVLLRAAHMATGQVITEAELPQEMVVTQHDVPQEHVGSLRNSEVALIREALAEANGNLERAAACLGIHRVTLYRKLKRYGLANAKP